MASSKSAPESFSCTSIRELSHILAIRTLLSSAFEISGGLEQLDDPVWRLVRGIASCAYRYYELNPQTPFGFGLRFPWGRPRLFCLSFLVLGDRFWRFDSTRRPPAKVDIRGKLLDCSPGQGQFLGDFFG